MRRGGGGGDTHQLPAVCRARGRQDPPGSQPASSASVFLLNNLIRKKKKINNKNKGPCESEGTVASSSAAGTCGKEEHPSSQPSLAEPPPMHQSATRAPEGGARAFGAGENGRVLLRNFGCKKQGLHTPALVCTAKRSVLKAVVLAASGHAYTVGDTEMMGWKGVLQPAVGAGQDVGVPRLPGYPQTLQLVKPYGGFWTHCCLT